MKRVAALLLTAVGGLLTIVPSASAQSTITLNATGCFPTSGGVLTTLSGSITPVPATDFDISVVSSVKGEVFHISLPAGFDITGASVSVGPAPLGRLTSTVFQDLDQDDVRDPSEPILATAAVTSRCHPGPARAEQCSNGNWQTFGLFTSQGDCVAWITTQGSNEPGQNVPGPPGGDATPDSVTGIGTSSFCGGTFEVTAESGPNGENPTGAVNCGSFFNGPVSCLNVTGDVALLNVETSTFGTLALRITDAGTTGDRVEATVASGCDLPQASYLDLGFSGDITVSD